MPNCPQCGEPSSAGDPVELCPKCMILGAFDTSLGTGPPETLTVDTAGTGAGNENFGNYRILRSIGEGARDDRKPQFHHSRLGRHREAVREFPKNFWTIRESQRTIQSDQWRASSWREALSASGERARSAAAYRDLLVLWKDADPDIPVVQQARAESSELLAVHLCSK